MSPSDIRDDGLPVIVGEKGATAYNLKKSGRTWDEIAEIVGYANGKVAAVEVRRYITESGARMDADERERILSLELDRLDTLFSIAWDQAQTGDLKAVETALKVINTRSKLLALETLSQTTGTVTNNTVVVTGDTQDFIRSLKLVDES
jgi:hypothetical protein